MTLQRHLTLVVPDLLSCAKKDVIAYLAFQAKQNSQLNSQHNSQHNAQQKLRLKALELLLSRALVSLTPPPYYDDLLFQLFGVARPEDGDLPVGALTAYLHDVGRIHHNNKWYLRTDPIHLRPDGDQLVVFGNQGLNITREEADALCAEINAVYDDMPWRLIALTPTQWVLESDEAPKICTFALEKVVGLGLGDFLPVGEQAKQWHAILNELQMLMHSSRINATRTGAGGLPINSVWFWGGGQLPAVSAGSESPWVQCWSNESLSLALAKLTNVPGVDLPADGEAWLSQATTPGRHVVVLENRKEFTATPDVHTWWQWLCAMDERWFSPCVDALRRGELDGLSLVTNHGQFDLRRPLLKRWWKRIKPVSHHIPQLSSN